MIRPIHIRNFKSIRDLKFEANRVNLFIGEPNTGKSNIIEALALFSPGTFATPKEILRFKSIADLFFDQKVANEISVIAGNWKFALKFNKNGSFEQSYYDGQTHRGTYLSKYNGGGLAGSSEQTTLRYYLFKPLTVFPNGQPGVLNPPFGDNLVAILSSNEELRQRVGSIIRSKGFRLQLKPADNELLIAKDVDDTLYSYAWTTVSETLRRVTFFMAALETNRDATLLFDEPEANTFPFYTKYLAERIALDQSNQFFITTHNPYLLSSVVEKAPKDDLAVFVTRMEKYETTVKRVPENRLPELLELDSDAFFNLDRLVGQ